MKNTTDLANDPAHQLADLKAKLEALCNRWIELEMNSTNQSRGSAFYTCRRGLQEVSGLLTQPPASGTGGEKE